MARGRERKALGTALVALVLVAGGLGLWIAIQGERFQRRVRGEARALLGGRADRGIAGFEAGSLPPPVRRYLEASGAARRAPVRGVRLLHGGKIRASEHGGWLPLRGEQYLSVDPPGFVWWGRMRIAPGLWIDARDRAVAGEASMLIRAASAWTLADARGPELDQGALLRLLAELTWIPTALADARYVRWAPVDDTSARATLCVGGRAVSATFRFAADGMTASIEAERYGDAGDGRSALTPWRVSTSDFRDVGGLRLPHWMEAVWTVDGQPRPYARWEVERIDLDPEGPY